MAVHRLKPKRMPDVNVGTQPGIITCPNNPPLSRCFHDLPRRGPYVNTGMKLRVLPDGVGAGAKRRRNPKSFYGQIDGQH